MCVYGFSLCLQMLVFLLLIYYHCLWYAVCFSIKNIYLICVDNVNLFSTNIHLLRHIELRTANFQNKYETHNLPPNVVY